MPWARATEAEPTGCAVSMYSSTTARRMAALRSSSISGTQRYRVPKPTGRPRRRLTRRRMGTVELVELGAGVLEVPVPFGPFADLVMEAEVPEAFLVARLTGRLLLQPQGLDERFL